MSSVTSLTPLPYPDATDAPYVHLDIKSLAEAVTESLFVVSATAPPSKVGRRWTRSTDGVQFISDGTTWRGLGTLAAGQFNTPPAGQAVPTGGTMVQLPGEGVKVGLTHSTVTNTDRIVCPWAGVYEIAFSLASTIAASGSRNFTPVKNGVAFTGGGGVSGMALPNTTGIIQASSAGQLVQCAANDYLGVTTDGSGAGTILAGGFVAVKFLGPV